MKLIITMAGEGPRFKNIGITNQIKYKLEIPAPEDITPPSGVDSPTMFDWAMKSLQAFFDEQFIFIGQEKHKMAEFVNDRCEVLGIDDRKIIELTNLPTPEGQATTALEAAQHVDSEDSIAIYNIDTFVEPGLLTPETIDSDGYIPVFKAGGTRWSYVSRGPSGNATQTAEKKILDAENLATIGLYYFDSMKLLEESHSQHGSQVEDDTGLVYVAPLYNWLIDKGLTVAVNEIDPNKVHVLGSPSDVSEFSPEFARRNRL